MTKEFLDSIELYVSGTMHDLRKKALFARENGYKQVALQHENSAALGEQILRGLKDARTREDV